MKWFRSAGAARPAWHGPWLVAGLAVIAVIAAAGERSIQKLRLPLEHHENGKVKTQLTAEGADVPPEGPIEADGVEVELLDENGQREVKVSAEHCRFDRTNKLVTSSTRVALENKDIQVSGTGLDWNLEERMIQLRTNVCVRLGKGFRAAMQSDDPALNPLRRLEQRDPGAAAKE